MKSTFILASFFTAALAAPAAMMVLPDDMRPMCADNFDFCHGSPAEKCECERSNVHAINRRLKQNGCNKRIEVSPGCMQITHPFHPTGSGTAMFPTGTGTATIPMGTGLADGTKACGRGLPQCPTGYTCREKFPGKVADVMFCYMDGKGSHSPAAPPPPPPFHAIPKPPPAQLCGGIAGLPCPDGYFCKYETLPDGMIVADRRGVCRPEPWLPKPRVGVPVDTTVEPVGDGLPAPPPVNIPSPTTTTP